MYLAALTAKLVTYLTKNRRSTAEFVKNYGSVGFVVG